MTLRADTSTELHQCDRCRRPIPPYHLFYTLGTHYLCESCGKDTKQDVELSEKIRAWL